MTTDEIRLVLDLIEQCYVAELSDWGGPRVDDDLDRRSIAFLREHRGLVTGIRSLENLEVADAKDARAA